MYIFIAIYKYFLPNVLKKKNNLFPLPSASHLQIYHEIYKKKLHTAMLCIQIFITLTHVTQFVYAHTAAVMRLYTSKNQNLML